VITLGPTAQATLVALMNEWMNWLLGKGNQTTQKKGKKEKKSNKHIN
jgi:hypothetical protein